MKALYVAFSLDGKNILLSDSSMSFQSSETVTKMSLKPKIIQALFLIIKKIKRINKKTNYSFMVWCKNIGTHLKLEITTIESQKFRNIDHTELTSNALMCNSNTKVISMFCIRFARCRVNAQFSDDWYQLILVG